MLTSRLLHVGQGLRQPRLYVPIVRLLSSAGGSDSSDSSSSKAPASTSISDFLSRLVGGSVSIYHPDSEPTGMEEALKAASVEAADKEKEKGLVVSLVDDSAERVPNVLAVSYDPALPMTTPFLPFPNSPSGVLPIRDPTIMDFLQKLPPKIIYLGLFLRKPTKQKLIEGEVVEPNKVIVDATDHSSSGGTSAVSEETADKPIVDQSIATTTEKPVVGETTDDTAKKSSEEAGTKKPSDPVKPGDKIMASQVKDVSEVHQVGTLAQIYRIVMKAQTMFALIRLHRRVRLVSVAAKGPPMVVKVEHLPSRAAPDVLNDPNAKGHNDLFNRTLDDVAKFSKPFEDHLQALRHEGLPPQFLPDAVAQLLAVMNNRSAHAEALQQVLEEEDYTKRVKLVLEMLMEQKAANELEKNILDQVLTKAGEDQQRAWKMKQYQALRKELGLEASDKDAMAGKFKDRVKNAKGIPDLARARIDEELEKLGRLERNSHEYSTTVNYLDWLTSLPWSELSEENYDVDRASAVLSKEHYGMDDVKQRILEFIAVSKLVGKPQGKILCFVGPPGVGKTSIGKSIAGALNREFYRFSVGGLSDVAEIKGHRRTYVGSMPGKVVQALKLVKKANPLILIDEIDKLGRGGHQGDPASALLETLDPNQNHSFLDHYLDVPVDLSKVLFICTANVVDTIPGPLLDRMELIRLSGYDVPEKLAIAEQYLVPKARKETGLEPADNIPATLELQREALLALVKWYCREAGVRNLEQHIMKIFRKLAYEVILVNENKNKQPTAGQKCGWRVGESDLVHYVGQPRFQSERLYDKPQPGVVMGLAYTAMGGSTLYIEAIVIRKREGKGALEKTGQLGGVMEESVRIAHTYARHKLMELDPSNAFFDTNDIHVHVPEGATPKDGPSAGVTITTSLLSLALNKSARPDLAMTGEISLTGKVLPVGGIKEKTIAARRAGVTCIILPAGNRKDFVELPKYLTEDLEVHYATEYSDVYKVAFGPVPAKAAAQPLPTAELPPLGGVPGTPDPTTAPATPPAATTTASNEAHTAVQTA